MSHTTNGPSLWAPGASRRAAGPGPMSSSAAMASPSDETLSRELYFLIYRFLENSPCTETRAVLARELEANGLLPVEYSPLTGAPLASTSVAQTHSANRHISSDFLLRALRQASTAVNALSPQPVPGIVSFLSAGRFSLLRSIEPKRDLSSTLSCLLKNGPSPRDASLISNLVNHRNHAPVVPSIRHYSDYPGSIVRSLMAREMTGPKPVATLLPTKYYEQMQQYKRILGHLSSVYCVSFDRTGKFIFTGADDRLVKMWSAVDGRLLMTLRGHSEEITDFSVDPENTMIATASCDKLIRVWCLKTTSPITVLKEHTATITCVKFSPLMKYPEKRYLVTASNDGSVCFWEYNPKTRVFRGRPTVFKERTRPTNQVTCVSFSCGGVFLAVGSSDCYLRVYHSDAPAGPTKILEIEEHLETVDSMQFSNHSMRFCSGSRDGTAKIWYFEKQRWKNIVLNMAEKLSLDQPNGSSGNSGPVEARREGGPAGGAPPEPASRSKLKVHMVGWTCDDAFVITSVSDNCLKVWDSRNGRLRHELFAHENEIFVIEAHPRDPRIFLSGSHDGAIIIWDIVTGTPLKSFYNAINGQGSGAIFDAKWSPDGSMFASTDAYGHLSLFGMGHSTAYRGLPEQIFFHTDYRPLLRDANNYVIDEQTQVAPHLMPPPFLVNIDGNPYPPELQRLVPGREACPLNQLVPYVHDEAAPAARQRNPPATPPRPDAPPEDGLDAEARNLIDARIEALQRGPPQQPQQAQQAQAGDNRGAARDRRNGDVEGVRLPVNLMVRPGQADLDMRPNWQRKPFINPLSEIDIQSMAARQGTLALNEAEYYDTERRKELDKEYERTLASQQPRQTRRTRRVIAQRRGYRVRLPPMRPGEPENLEEEDDEDDQDYSEQDSPSSSEESSNLSDEDWNQASEHSRMDRATARDIIRRSGGMPAGLRLDRQERVGMSDEAIRNVRRQRMNWLMAQRNGTGAAATNGSGTRSSRRRTEGRRETASGGGGDDRSRRRSRRRTVVTREHNSTEEEEEEEEPEARASRRAAASSSRARSRRRRSPQEEEEEEEEEEETPEEQQPQFDPQTQALRREQLQVIRNAFRRRQAQRYESITELPDAFRPSEWLTDTRPKRTPYFPQVGDDVVYFRSGHQNYLDAVRERGLYRLQSTVKPYRLRSSNTDEIFARVEEVKFAIKPNVGVRVACLRMVVLDPEAEEPVTGTKFSIKYHDVENVVDFIVLKKYYDTSIGREWKPGDEFRALIDDKWWFGLINSQKTAQPFTWFQCFAVTWANSDSEYLSPWDLEPIPEGYDRSSAENPLEGLEVTEEEREHIIANDFEDTEDRLYNGLLRVMEFSQSEDFNVPVDLNVHPVYGMIIPYLMDLSTIRGRLENRFYRRTEALIFDVDAIEANALQYNEEDSEIVKRARIVTAVLRRFIADEHAFDPMPLHADIIANLETFLEEAAAAHARASRQSTGGAGGRTGNQTTPEEPSDRPRRSTRRPRAIMSDSEEGGETVGRTATNRSSNSRRSQRAIRPPQHYDDSSNEALMHQQQLLLLRRADRRPTTPVQVAIRPWKQNCRELVDYIFTLQDSEPFRTPVDPLIYPNYNQVIDTPMDLTTVKEQLLADIYDSPVDFCKDMRLIFANSKQFNTNKKSRIYSMTIRLSGLFEEKMRKIMSDHKSASKFLRNGTPRRRPLNSFSAAMDLERDLRVSGGRARNSGGARNGGGGGSTSSASASSSSGFKRQLTSDEGDEEYGGTRRRSTKRARMSTAESEEEEEEVSDDEQEARGSSANRASKRRSTRTRQRPTVPESDEEETDQDETPSPPAKVRKTTSSGRVVRKPANLDSDDEEEEEETDDETKADAEDEEVDEEEEADEDERDGDDGGDQGDHDGGGGDSDATQIEPEEEEEEDDTDKENGGRRSSRRSGRQRDSPQDDPSRRTSRRAAAKRVNYDESHEEEEDGGTAGGGAAGRRGRIREKNGGGGATNRRPPPQQSSQGGPSRSSFSVINESSRSSIGSSASSGRTGRSASEDVDEAHGVRRSGRAARPTRRYADESEEEPPTYHHHHEGRQRTVTSRSRPSGAVESGRRNSTSSSNRSARRGGSPEDYDGTDLYSAVKTRHRNAARAAAAASRHDAIEEEDEELSYDEDFEAIGSSYRNGGAATGTAGGSSTRNRGTPVLSSSRSVPLRHSLRT